MWKILLTALLTFISTELDDFFVFVVLFGRCKNNQKVWAVVGQIVSLAAVTVLCAFVAHYLEKIPSEYLRFCGIIPVLLGIKAFFDKDDEEKQEENSEGVQDRKGVMIFVTAFLLTLAASSDNLGVYIPVFTKYTVTEKLITLAVFLVLQCGWSFLQIKAASLPVVKNLVEKSKKWLVPVVFILLGLFIFFM